jgi:hypothetical protein
MNDFKCDKIKQQFRRYKYRDNFLKCVHKTFMQIRFIK